MRKKLFWIVGSVAVVILTAVSVLLFANPFGRKDAQPVLIENSYKEVGAVWDGTKLVSDGGGSDLRTKVYNIINEAERKLNEKSYPSINEGKDKDINNIENIPSMLQVKYYNPIVLNGLGNNKVENWDLGEILHQNINSSSEINENISEILRKLKSVEGRKVYFVDSKTETINAKKGDLIVFAESKEFNIDLLPQTDCDYYMDNNQKRGLILYLVLEPGRNVVEYILVQADGTTELKTVNVVVEK